MKRASAEGDGSIWVRPGNESCNASNQRLHTPRAALSNTMPSALMCVLLADVRETSLPTYPRPFDNDNTFYLKRALHTHVSQESGCLGRYLSRVYLSVIPHLEETSVTAASGCVSCFFFFFGEGKDVSSVCVCECVRERKAQDFCVPWGSL